MMLCKSAFSGDLEEEEEEEEQERRTMVPNKTTVRRWRRGIPYQPGKDVEYEGSAEKEAEKDCFDCNGRCLDEAAVKCNFVNDCGMKDENNCPNPNNLTIVDPIENVIVTDPPAPVISGTVDPATIDPSKFAEYFAECDPAVFASCRFLDACLKN